MDRHLVAVEVRVKRSTDQRVDLDGLALDQLRLEGLNPQAVQRRRPVQHHRMLRNHFFQYRPNIGVGVATTRCPLYTAFRSLDVLAMTQFD